MAEADPKISLNGSVNQGENSLLPLRETGNEANITEDTEAEDLELEAIKARVREIEEDPEKWLADQAEIDEMSSRSPSSDWSPGPPATPDPPIAIATEKGELETVKQMLNDGADVNTRDSMEASLLTIAVRENINGHYYPGMELVSLLLNAGADIDLVDDEGYTAVMRAAKDGHLDILKVLIDGAQLDGNSDHGSALHEASEFGQLSCVKMLLAAGANPCDRNLVNETAKDVAVTGNIFCGKGDKNLKSVIYDLCESAERAYTEYINIGPQGLQLACKRVIKSHTQQHALPHLPLPSILIKFLQSDVRLKLEFKTKWPGVE